jgi:hypothetical protein
MATDEDKIVKETIELVGEWDPVVFNEYAICLAHHKKSRKCAVS